MASLISRIIGVFTGGSAEPEAPQRGEAVIYEGLSICAAPIKEGGQWRLAGVIIKQGDEVDLERSFTRADVFYTRAEAESFSIRKGKQIIDEQGTKLFENGEEQGRA